MPMQIYTEFQKNCTKFNAQLQCNHKSQSHVHCVSPKKVVHQTHGDNS